MVDSDYNIENRGIPTYPGKEEEIIVWNWKKESETLKSCKKLLPIRYKRALMSAGTTKAVQAWSWGNMFHPKTALTSEVMKGLSENNCYWALC